MSPSTTLAEAASAAPDEVVVAVQSSENGLTSEEAASRLLLYGRNVLTSNHVTACDVLVRQLRSPLLLLLLGAAAVSGATGDLTDAVIITAIVALSIGLGFFNEYRSELAVAALHQNIRHEAVVRRDGEYRRVSVLDLVPGDVVRLGIGDIVPADVRILCADRLECDEAVLTGESMPVTKVSVSSQATLSPLELPNCAFMGTVVHGGEGVGVVIETGAGTVFGGIAAGLAEEDALTAFQVGLKNFSSLLVRVAGVLTIGIFIVNVAFSRPIIDALLFSLAIAIGITPSLLPAIVSVSLSTGSRQLARKRVLVKRLVTIEDLGNIRTLFTDKTGTLTEGAITFDRSLDADGLPSSEPLLFGLVCNQALVTTDGPVGGNTLDQALWVSPDAASLAERATGPNAFRRVGELPFDHDRQLASVLVDTADGGRLVVTKGAPEAVLARCDTIPKRAQETLDGLFTEGARVVAVATKGVPDIAVLGPSDEAHLRFVGFLVFIDRPKVGAMASMQELAALGITVKVITGDNGKVAAKVSRDLGVAVNGVLSGADIANLDDAELAHAIPNTSIFARVSPDQKARIIKAARVTGDDVAFMGDGVNDAVALHAADVGISVDSATDVAKDAADIVLLDKDLAVLAEGVREGRRIFANTLKYVLMATSSNFGNMFSAAGASLFLTFLPMLPSQVLLNNLLYDVGQLAIPSDNIDSEIVARPAAWDITFVRQFMTVFGPLSSIFDFATFFVMLRLLHAGHNEFRTGWFVESLATQTLVIFVIRTRRVPFFRSRPSGAMTIVPVAAAVIGAALPFTPLVHLLGFTPLPAQFFLVLVGMIGVYLALVEFAKTRFYRREFTPPIPSSSRTRSARHVTRRARRFTHHDLREANFR